MLACHTLIGRRKSDDAEHIFLFSGDTITHYTSLLGSLSFGHLSTMQLHTPPFRVHCDKSAQGATYVHKRSDKTCQLFHWSMIPGWMTLLFMIARWADDILTVSRKSWISVKFSSARRIQSDSINDAINQPQCIYRSVCVFSTFNEPIGCWPLYAGPNLYSDHDDTRISDNNCHGGNVSINSCVQRSRWCCHR